MIMSFLGGLSYEDQSGAREPWSMPAGLLTRKGRHENAWSQ